MSLWPTWDPYFCRGDIVLVQANFGCRLLLLLKCWRNWDWLYDGSIVDGIYFCFVTILIYNILVQYYYYNLHLYRVNWAWPVWIRLIYIIIMQMSAMYIWMIGIIKEGNIIRLTVYNIYVLNTRIFNKVILDSGRSNEWRRYSFYIEMCVCVCICNWLFGPV